MAKKAKAEGVLSSAGAGAVAPVTDVAPAAAVAGSSSHIAAPVDPSGKSKKGSKKAAKKAEAAEPVFVFGQQLDPVDKELDAFFAVPAAVPVPLKETEVAEAVAAAAAEGGAEDAEDNEGSDEEESLGWLKQKKSDEETQLKENAEKTSRTVFVGNLPVTCKPKHLEQLFKQYGNVESVRLRSVHLVSKLMPKKATVILRDQHTSEESTMNAYVVFKDQESAKKALASNATQFQGKHIRVDLASSSAVYDRHRSVFIGNIPFKSTEEELFSFFADCGTVEAVRIVRDKVTSIGKGFGYVLFGSKESVPLAITKEGQPFNGRAIRVSNVERPKNKHDKQATRLRDEKPAPVLNGVQRRLAEKKKLEEGSAGEGADQSAAKRARGDGGVVRPYQGTVAQPGVLPKEITASRKQRSKSRAAATEAKAKATKKKSNEKKKQHKARKQKASSSSS